MNIYKIKHKNKIYVTNAENLIEAEDKFIEQFNIDLKISTNILTEKVEDDENINIKGVIQF